MVAYGEALKRAAEESPFDPRAYLDYEALKALLSVWKSKFYGAVVRNRRVVLHAIDGCTRRTG